MWSAQESPVEFAHGICQLGGGDGTFQEFCGMLAAGKARKILAAREIPKEFSWLPLEGKLGFIPWGKCSQISLSCKNSSPKGRGLDLVIQEQSLELGNSELGKCGIGERWRIGRSWRRSQKCWENPWGKLYLVKSWDVTAFCGFGISISRTWDLFCGFRVYCLDLGFILGCIFWILDLFCGFWMYLMDFGSISWIWDLFSRFGIYLVDFRSVFQIQDIFCSFGIYFVDLGHIFWIWDVFYGSGIYFPDLG